LVSFTTWIPPPRKRLNPNDKEDDKEDVTSTISLEKKNVLTKNVMIGFKFVKDNWRNLLFALVNGVMSWINVVGIFLFVSLILLKLNQRGSLICACIFSQ
jgi:Ca2+-dependent lipid-binding protein